MIRKAALSAGIFLSYVLGITGIKSRANDRRAEASHPPVGKFVNVDGTSVHYVKAGSGAAVILLHGAGGNLRDFTFALADKLAKDYTVLAFDRPGHGYTDALHNQGESPAEQASLLKAAADQLGVSNPIIAGYSIGGAVALRWALDYQKEVRGLMVISGVSNPWVKPPSYVYKLAGGPVTGPVFAATVSAFAPKSVVEDTLRSVFAPHEVPHGYLDYIGAGLTMRKSCILANGRQVMALLPHIKEQSKRYRELTLPVEIIHGRKDLSVPAVIHAHVLKKNILKANLTLIQDLGHSTQHHAHAEIFAGLKRILAAG